MYHLFFDQVLLLAMKDMNVPKMTSVDLPLFNGIVSDLFPGIDAPIIDYGKVSLLVKGTVTLYRIALTYA